ncbi:RNA polymerase sigma factor [Mucisphaera sp.]|uniref:RNA polymerase sigma factor n=1 Tax=Mucisphaera sp. TaxID=2913024 RepID=UPI003D0FE770
MVERDASSVFLDWLGRYGPAVVKVSRAYAVSEEERQDLAQEILLQAWRSVERFEGRSAASTWFYRVALNTAMNWKRKDERRRLAQKPLFDVAVVEAEGEEASERAERREVVERLYGAIQRLPKGDKALVLLYLEELSYREMSEVLGISESHVGVKLNRAKKALRELMEVNRDGD